MTHQCNAASCHLDLAAFYLYTIIIEWMIKGCPVFKSFPSSPAAQDCLSGKLFPAMSGCFKSWNVILAMEVDTRASSRVLSRCCRAGLDAWHVACSFKKCCALCLRTQQGICITVTFSKYQDKRKNKQIELCRECTNALCLSRFSL